uniref:Uncharacterized protein n=1 Tax=Rhizophora mucronata TaxID=61149 RepID=A0A2P2MWA2_RHIMU
MNQGDTASRRMFVAALMSFLACPSACLAKSLSKPIETSIATELSGGSIEGAMKLGYEALCKKHRKQVVMVKSAFRHEAISTKHSN